MQYHECDMEQFVPERGESKTMSHIRQHCPVLGTTYCQKDKTFLQILGILWMNIPTRIKRLKI